ncbi:hypothetical protein ACLBXM_09040 [Xanthobacteraceae bacterium A53D]
MPSALRDGVRHLESTAHISLLVLALASGVYTYIGVRDLLDGSVGAVIFAALIYSTAVSVGIYAFWTFMLRFLPHMVEAKARMLMFGAMALGSIMIVAMSSWLNASALAGSAALEQHLGVTLANYSRDLDRTHAKAVAGQGLAPDIQMAATRFSQLADAERTGSLTGTTGSGTVVQLLGQMSSQLGGLSKEVAANGERVKDLHERAAKHLAAMRELVSGTGPIGPRAEAFGTQATAFAGALTQLQQANVAPAVKRTAAEFTNSFIAPAADGRTPDVIARQNEVVGRVQAAVAAQARALEKAADSVIERPDPAPPRYEQISSAEAVLRYAGDFIPSWAGAISIDLLPGVLVLVLCVVHGAIRREGRPAASADHLTAGQLLAALQMAHDMEKARAALLAQSPTLAPAQEPAAQEPPEEADKVTALHGRPAKRD